MTVSLYNARIVILKIFIFICLLLPTGSLFSINIKMLFLGLLILTTFLGDGRSFVRFLTANFIPILVLFFLIIVAFFKNGLLSETFAQAKDILVFFIMVSLCSSLVDKEEQGDVIIKTILSSLLVIGLLKIAIVVFSIMTGLSIASIVSIISKIFNTSLMAMESDDIAVGRINFMSDALLPICMFVVMQNAIVKKATTKNTVIYFVLAISLVLSLSRFLWGIGLFCTILAVVINLKYIKGFSIAISLCLLATFLISLPSVQALIEFRFLSKQSNVSDDTRVYQLQHIMESFANAPVLGNGLGYYLPSLIRSYDAKYSYEVQIPALLMQIGFVGTFFIFLLVFSTIYSRSRVLNVKLKIVYLLLTITWIASGFFNPVFISSSGGMVFLLLYSLPKYIDNNFNKTRVAHP